MGFGYLSKEQPINDINMLHDCIVSYRDNKEVRRIINTYLKKNRCEIIEF